MKKLVIPAIFFIFSSFYSNLLAQNKTLGIGVVTPNPNAALHVESPTGNQGFIMPRLTTTQRLAMSSILKDFDFGLMLYDTNLKTTFIWDGISWKSTAQVAGGPKLLYPYVDTVKISPGVNANLLRLIYTGAAVENVGVAHFENLNPNSGFATIFGRTNSATNGVADFVVNNPANNNDVISVSTNGLGTAGRFTTNNKISRTPTLWVETNSDSTLSAAIYGLNTGKGDPAGVFRINNTLSNASALFAETNGGGPSVFGNQIGLGRAGQFQITNALNTNAAVRAFTSGTGYAGFYSINNAANTTASLFSTTNGGGAAVQGMNTGTGNGFGGLFSVTQATNTFPAVQAGSSGTGPGVRVFQDVGTGAGMDIFMRNLSSTAPGFAVDQQGLGNGGNFNIVNASNSGTSLLSSTTGTGSAGNFTINNTANASTVLTAITNGTGAAFSANHTGATGNVAVFQSGGANVARIDKAGQGFFNGGTVASGADVAEMFDVEGDRNTYEPGDVLVISEMTDRTVEKSREPNSIRVVGVYATKPGVLLTEKSIDENMDNLVPMGVIGVIPTKVCLENGPIYRGDLLVTSSTKGHAMKAIPINMGGVLIYPTGAIIGKALENFNGNQSGLIKVLVNVK